MGCGSRYGCTEGGEINLFLGASVTEQTNNSQGWYENPGKDLGGDHEEGVVGLKFKLGPVEIGGQVSAERLQNHKQQVLVTTMVTLLMESRSM